MLIVDDVHEVAFVHIPKCGGTSVSRQLRSLDSNKEFFNVVSDHPELGRTHLAHLPLRYLRDYFPETYRRIAAYRAFALVRDPYDRFASATFQHMREFRGFTRGDVTSEVALAEAHRIMDWLTGKEHFADAEYIHFTRQSDYVELDGAEIVGNVFPLENVAELIVALERTCGVRLDPERRENTTFASDSAIVRVVRSAKPVYSRLTSWAFRRDLLLLARRLRLQNPSPFYETVRTDSEVAAFIEAYYGKDFQLYAAAKTRPKAGFGAEHCQDNPAAARDHLSHNHVY